MNENNEIKRELEELKASKLASWHKRSDQQSLPNSYWNEQLDRAISTGYKTDDVKPARRISLFYVASVAAGLLLLLAGSWMFFHAVTSEGTVQAAGDELATISDDEIVNYINANLDDFDLALLSTYAQNEEESLQSELDISLDILEGNLPEDAEWLFSDEDGIELF